VISTVQTALSDTRVVVVHGARQTGKTTLTHQLAQLQTDRRYITLDDAPVLAATTQSPDTFIATLTGPVIIDEIQRAPGLMLAIKASVDRSNAPGRFLVTGSSNVLTLPKLADSLAGRMETILLRPCSQGEIEGMREAFIDRAFSHTGPTIRKPPATAASVSLTGRLVRGGYPEAIARPDPERRVAWFASYIDSIINRDVRELANIAGLVAMPGILALLAARAGGLLNYSELSRSSGVATTTLKRYIALLEATFLVVNVLAWSTNLGKRWIKSPKTYLCDTGLLCALLGPDAPRLAANPSQRGHIVENFVALELLKQIDWSTARPRLFHARTTSGVEVDFVLEDSSGHVVGIEVKSSSSVATKDFSGLMHLKDEVGKRFVRGIVLYDAAESITVPLSFADKMIALPISTLWADA